MTFLISLRRVFRPFVKIPLNPKSFFFFNENKKIKRKVLFLFVSISRSSTASTSNPPNRYPDMRSLGSADSTSSIDVERLTRLSSERRIHALGVQDD